MSIENIRELTYRAGVPFTQDGKPYDIKDGKYYAVPRETMELLIEARKENPEILEFKVGEELRSLIPDRLPKPFDNFYASGRMVLVDGKILNLRYQTLAMDLEQAEEEDKP